MLMGISLELNLKNISKLWIYILRIVKTYMGFAHRKTGPQSIKRIISTLLYIAHSPCRRNKNHYFWLKKRYKFHIKIIQWIYVKLIHIISQLVLILWVGLMFVFQYSKCQLWYTWCLVLWPLWIICVTIYSGTMRI